MSLPRGFREEAYRMLDAEIDELEGHIAENCESPIEVAFATAFILHGRFGRGDVAFLPPGYEWKTEQPRYDWVLSCQRQIGTYRADFIAAANPERDTCRVVVECDGHDFHERTKEQAARDRSRDRDMQAAGFKVFRFTGSEIYRSAFNCAEEVYKELWRMQIAETGGGQ